MSRIAKNPVLIPEKVEVALGVEIRKESLYVQPDYVRGAGLGAGSGGPTNPVDGSYQTKEAYTEEEAKKALEDAQAILEAVEVRLGKG